jgi:integrase
VIRKRRNGLQVQVYAGRDPFTGRKRWVSRQVPGQTKQSYRQAKKVEAELLEHVDRGQHRGSFQQLATRLGVRARLHDLRHFMVTQLVAGGVDWRTVSGRAGHADGHMTLGTYAHFHQAQDRQAAEFMDKLLVTTERQSR